MCGICGYFGSKKIDEDTFVSMRDTMIHRGPDDAGIWITSNNEKNIGLAHRRLSVMDLSSQGHQPMLSADKKIAVVFNGEIYNYRELKKELIACGYHFESDCDTEIVVYAYKKWGCKCFGRFDGMWAIAIYDASINELILCRDRIGKKPLYYYRDMVTGDVVFASELKPIMKYPGFKKLIREDMIGFFLCNKYIASPNTIFEDTYKVVPGTYLMVNDTGIREHRFWSIIDEKNRISNSLWSSLGESIDELDKCVSNAVSKRLIADVPIGVFLSGGIDSSLITAVAQKKMNNPLKTFTIGFHDSRNEAEYAKEIAGYLGTDHRELYIGDQETYKMLEDLPVYFDEPFSDSSLIPTMLVSQIASDDVTVVLSGDGGDELFCGYKMYDWTYVAQHADFIGSVLNMIPGIERMKGRLSPELRAFINNRDEKTKTQLYVDVMEENASRLLGLRIQTKFGIEEKLNYSNWQERRMMLDMLTYLPDDILAKTDRATMKYSIEGRCPLVDSEVIKCSFEIPHHFKYHYFNKKHILKELAYNYIPREMLDRPKQGFSVPLVKWLRTYLKPRIAEYTDEGFVKKQGIFDNEVLRWLVEKQEMSNKTMYSSMLWSYYVFQRWYEQYVGL